MEVEEKTLQFYKLGNGCCPCEEWIHSLKDRSARAAIRARITRVRSGNLGNYRNLRRGLLELRIDHGPGYRIYCGRSGNNLIILLLGGTKRGQGMDIIKAREYWDAYCEERKNHAD